MNGNQLMSPAEVMARLGRGSIAAVPKRKARGTGEKSLRKRRTLQTMTVAPEPIAGGMALVLPLRTLNRTNEREHWAATHKRSARERGIVASVLQLNRRQLPALPWTVTLTRSGPRRLDDDNLRAALKSVRDGVADAAGLDDADRRLAFVYGEQQAGEYQVRIEVVNQGRMATGYADRQRTDSVANDQDQPAGSLQRPRSGAGIHRTGKP